MIELQHIFNSLADRTRLNLVLLLEQYENISVSELAEAVSVSVPAVSQHMKTLELSGVVRRERYGQRTCYQLQREDPFIQDLLALINHGEVVYR